jgi:hypothetical protein
MRPFEVRSFEGAEIVNRPRQKALGMIARQAIMLWRVWTGALAKNRIPLSLFL